MEASALVYGVALIITCLGSVSTNVLLLILFANNLKLHSETWALTLNLTVCDMVLGLTIIPGGIYNLFGGAVFTKEPTLCGLAAFLFVMLQLVSLHSLTWVTIDRFTEICFPLRYAQLFTSRRTWLIIACLWIYCIAQAACPFMGFGQYVYNENTTLCSPRFGPATKAYSVELLGLGLVIPILIICVLYIAIVHIAKRQARRGTFVCNEHHCYYVPIRPYFRNTILLVSSALYIFVCWIPYITISFYEIFHGQYVPSVVEKIATWLVLLSSVLNPWLTSLGQK